MRSRILFCNVAYMQFYDDSIYDKPKNGGAYVSLHGDALEKYNFQECDDGKYRGFVETGHHNGYEVGNETNTFNLLHIEKIDPSYKKEEFIDDVLVVFCAKSEIKGKTVIVGWYKNARVYRFRPTYKDRFYNLEARKADCVLLKEYDRKFEIPRAKGNKGVFGFGQLNIRFADYKGYSEFMEKVINYINENNVESLNHQEIVEEYQEFIEDGTGKKVYINKYERNPKARKECLRIHGTKCFICGFDAKKVYGNEFEGKIQVHHIIPIHKQGVKYKVNPQTDLIPICPNCHMILHTKANGKEPSVEELKNKFK